jgi:hypothetical protein
MQHIKTVMEAGSLCYKYYQTPTKKIGDDGDTADGSDDGTDEGQSEGMVAALFKPDAVVVHLPNAMLLIILLIAVISFLWLWWRWT